MTTAIALWALFQLLGLVVSHKIFGYPGSIGWIVGGILYHALFKGMLL